MISWITVAEGCIYPEKTVFISRKSRARCGSCFCGSFLPRRLLVGPWTTGRSMMAMLSLVRAILRIAMFSFFNRYVYFAANYRRGIFQSPRDRSPFRRLLTSKKLGPLLFAIGMTSASDFWLTSWSGESSTLKLTQACGSGSLNSLPPSDGPWNCTTSTRQCPRSMT